ncbi:High mobility group [Aphelenchoides avenae]|nr:High mobility group [Aphelenchus avenae]
MAYVKEHTDPQQDRKENLRTLGARWKALSKEEKQEYAEKAAALGEKRRREYDSLLEQTKQRMTELKQALQADFYEAMGRSETPKKPPSARMIYVNEQLARRKITADAFSEWKAMTEEDKKPYEFMAELLKREHQRLWDEWDHSDAPAERSADASREGHPDVDRKVAD